MVSDLQRGGFGACWRVGNPQGVRVQYQAPDIEGHVVGILLVSSGFNLRMEHQQRAPGECQKK